VPYPVRFEADYAERRSRLTVFFRLILVIPLAIAVFVYGIVASIAVIIAWFAIVITARYPDALYEFMAGYTRFITRVGGYALLLCDPYPRFSAAGDPGYPIRLEFADPLERYSRWKTFFRFILAIPILFLRYLLSVLVNIGAVAAWFVIVIMGHLPRGLFELMAWCVSYIARSDAYVFLLTETYPPFEESLAPSGEAQPLLAEAQPLLAEAQPSMAEAQPPADEAPLAAEEAQTTVEEERSYAEEPQPSPEEPQPSAEVEDSSAHDPQPPPENAEP
jgi:hypothetical protein